MSREFNSLVSVFCSAIYHSVWVQWVNSYASNVIYYIIRLSLFNVNVIRGIR